MSKIIITLIIWGGIISCTTVMTCGSDRLFTKGSEYCSEHDYFWFEKPEPAFKEYQDKELSDKECRELINELLKAMDKPTSDKPISCKGKG